MAFDLLLFGLSFAAAAVAAIAGFGIGSLITPFLSPVLGTKLAVAFVSVPHLVATGLRLWLLKGHVDKRVFLVFGLMSAAGGLSGALLNAYLQSPALTMIFGAILIFAGFTGATNLSSKMRFDGPVAVTAGLISGFLGGLVGNQGGIRSAALLGFQVSKETFVATATAIGLVVDLARMPIYFYDQGTELIAHPKWIAVSVAGAILGTLIGGKFLRHIPEATFRKIVSILIFILGVYMFSRGWADPSI